MCVHEALMKVLVELDMGHKHHRAVYTCMQHNASNATLLDQSVLCGHAGDPHGEHVAQSISAISMSIYAIYTI